MKLNDKKLITYLIVIVPLALVVSVSFFITSFYINKLTSYFEQAKSNSITEYIDSKKAESELWTNQLILLFEYTNNRLKPEIKKEIKSEVNLAYQIAHRIYKKNKSKRSAKEIKEMIKESLSRVVFENPNSHLFITDFNSNMILKGSQNISKDKFARYVDYDNRSIILEEIQKVRRRGEGYLTSKLNNLDDKEIIFVKNLKLYNWFVGRNRVVKEKRGDLKKDLLDLLKSIPIDKDEFMGVYEGSKKVYLSEDLSINPKELTKDPMWHKHQVKKHYYYTRYYKEFDWYLIHGFNSVNMSTKAKAKQTQLEEMLSQEMSFIIKVSILIVIFTVFLSLILSVKINNIFKNYQAEVERRAQELQELNDSLEVKVQEEVESHRQKDKMLTQQSKMAEMGDMLSMIAHQWRQPLNQMSYVFMNIDSAYEYDELTKEYLETKIKEGNELLEFMSVTIDDFRNYFMPDKEKQEVLVDEVLDKALFLIQKSLSAHNISLIKEYEADVKVLMYRNEFIQVILNLIKNAKDVLLDKGIHNAKITISSKIVEGKLLVVVSDNGGGVDEKIMQKIFEPYFSTKDQKSGTGLGLYMSKMIIEGHFGGSLSVRNSQDGAAFTIEIYR